MHPFRITYFFYNWNACAYIGIEKTSFNVTMKIKELEYNLFDGILVETCLIQVTLHYSIWTNWMKYICVIKIDYVGDVYNCILEFWGRFCQILCIKSGCSQILGYINEGKSPDRLSNSLSFTIAMVSENIPEMVPETKVSTAEPAAEEAFDYEEAVKKFASGRYQLFLQGRLHKFNCSRN